MEIPSRISVNGIGWTVNVVPMDHDTDGSTHIYRAAVEINDVNTPDLQQQTFWHEAIHCMYRSYCWGEAPMSEEEVATRVGAGLYSFFKENGGEVEFPADEDSDEAAASSSD